jgi:hypothetical protein
MYRVACNQPKSRALFGSQSLCLRLKVFRRATVASRVAVALVELHPDHPLASVVAGKQSDQRLRCVLEAIDHIFLHLERAGGDP